MVRETGLPRESIVKALTHALEPLAHVHAFWEAGAAAFDRVDEWSDIDLYIVVDDASVTEAFQIVEKTLEGLSPIELRHEVSWPPASGVFQKFYRLRNASEYLLIDLAVMTQSAPDKFLTREIHGDAVFFFNKGGSVRIPALDAEAFVRGLLARRQRLRERMVLFGPFVPKEILRGNRLEALEFYRALVIPSLVEALRMRYGPRHYDFRMRYVYRELPSDVVRRLETLAFIKDPEDLAAKYREARAWFDKAIEEVDETQVRREVAGSSK
jgi:predicted nucleotidyltransferase